MSKQYWTPGLVRGFPEVLDELNNAASVISLLQDGFARDLLAVKNSIILPSSTLGGAVILAPNTATRNTVVPTITTAPNLILKAIASQSVALLDWQDSAGNSVASMSVAGLFSTTNATVTALAGTGTRPVLTSSTGVLSAPALGSLNKLYGVDAAGTSMEYKAVLTTLAGAMSGITSLTASGDITTTGGKFIFPGTFGTGGLYAKISGTDYAIVEAELNGGVNELRYGYTSTPWRRMVFYLDGSADSYYNWRSGLVDLMTLHYSNGLTLNGSFTQTSGSFTKTGFAGTGNRFVYADLNGVLGTTSAAFPTSAALGDIIYGSAANVWTNLTGNTTTTKKFLTQTGDGVNSAAPGWNTIVTGDINTLTNTWANAQTFTSAAQFNNTVGITGTLTGAIANFSGAVGIANVLTMSDEGVRLHRSTGAGYLHWTDGTSNRWTAQRNSPTTGNLVLHANSQAGELSMFHIRNQVGGTATAIFDTENGRLALGSNTNPTLTLNVTGVSSFTGRIGIGGSPNAAIMLDVGIGTSVAGVTGTSQYGIIVRPLFGTGATSNITVFETQGKGADGTYITTNQYGVRIQSFVKGSVQTVTNAYGLYIDAVSHGGTLNYAIYTNGGLIRFGDAVTAASTLTSTGVFTASSTSTFTGVSTHNGGITMAAGINMVLATSTGTKIGTGTTQLLGFWNATPVDQPAHIPDPTGGLVIDIEARAAIALINARDAEIGITAAS